MAPQKKLPAFQFYTGDWLKDPAVRSVSIAARGLWIDMLSLMHESSRRGYLQHLTGKPVTAEQLARMTGCSTDDVSRLLQELENSGVFSCTDDGVIFNRRMVRDEAERTGTTERVRRHRQRARQSIRGDPEPCNGDVTPVKRECNTASSSSSSSSSSERSSDRKERSLEDPTSSGAEPGEDADSTPPSPRVMTFPCTGKGGTEWHLTEDKLAEYRDTYPYLDVLAEMRKARQWLIDRPTRRKTFGGMPAFLTNWLNRAQDSGRGSREGTYAKPDKLDGFRESARRRGLIP